MLEFRNTRTFRRPREASASGEWRRAAATMDTLNRLDNAITVLTDVF